MEGAVRHAPETRRRIVTKISLQFLFNRFTGGTPRTDLMEWLGTVGGKRAKSWYCACATAAHLCVSKLM